MISFIIIGYNEGWKINQTLKAVSTYIDQNNIEDSEIIYVDSNSTDGSLESVLSFDRKITVLQITGHCNAAIARNVGADQASGVWYFFLDGDMEINPDWHKSFIKYKNEGKKFLTGQLIDVFYDNSWKFLIEKPLFGSSKLNRTDITNGGAFVIHKELWRRSGGMKTEFDKSQDIDLCYRLARSGFHIFRTAETYVRHHTIQYNFNSKISSELKGFKKLMYRGLLLRKHLFNRAVFKRIVRINYTVFLFIPALILSILVHPLIALFYLLAIGLRGASNYMKYRSAIRKNLLQMILKYFLIDIGATVGFLFFFPPKQEIKFKTINQ